ncbi:hypothetical protein [uncultured Eubacterium sp.]|uniref:hypothetical protein n=1 Tax=uncultured Eubacterium sp. TaxID=165185 RepID=UPI0025DE7BFC|nr:hypothetical protein [uncultured Eubacterium sp.]
MIKLEHTVLASPEQMAFIIEGMRNPMNSWDKSDSGEGCHERTIWGSIERDDLLCEKCGATYESHCVCSGKKQFILGNNDHSLMQRLSNAGTDHRKYMRMMPVYVRITAPLYWWKEFDTYKVGTIANSCSTMHKIQEKEFTLEDFSCEHLDLDNYDFLKKIIVRLNHYRDIYINGDIVEYPNCGRQIFKPKSKKIWWQMIQLLPSSYNQTRNVMLNYEVLANIYKSRKDHKLDEWREFCQWIETLPYSELIIGEKNAQ